MNLILTGIDDSPPSTPFAWLPSLRDRLAAITNDETVPARRLRTLGHAHQLVAIMADLLPQTEGLREIDEADCDDVVDRVSTARQRGGDDACGDVGRGGGGSAW